MIEPRPQLEGISMYSPGKPIEELQREKGLTKILKMASNENPFGCSPLAEEAIREEMKEMTRYPETTSPALALKLAARLGISSDQLIFGNGSDEIIRLLTRSYINQGDEVVMASVTFPRYKTNVLIEGGIPVEVGMKNGTHDLDGLLRAITNETKMVFVCNPNNPTGTIVERQALKDFIEQVPSNVLLVMDEAYYEYADSKEYLETLSLLDDYPNMVILRTFSKVYGLAALRIGYGMMHPGIVHQLRKVKDPFNVNRLAEAAASASLEDEAFLIETIAENREGRRYLTRHFEDMGLDYFTTQTNFIMVDVGFPAEKVYEELLNAGIIIRPGHLMGYPTMIRVTIGQDEENESFIRELRQILNMEVLPVKEERGG
ncbi:histidinol-phosphate aminotransferase [Halobacillus andaensis]|uniref:Histidinol-phosphate aminotransferase n=1 Tax=Halobacillus andaensis TaxID=1176239 RepID=A0A917B1N1_HALAA|nr:histidinol-phosphate transaminase [Halobacillus andaensis]MBP2003909.1 histidinol-phosphate aminotransferase [Halobacillus andaensis]GGF14217.1 histidinol-phosphate aminotransferase [Halobacillus andaensis]